MGAAHHGLGNLIAMVDINALQADGPTAGVLRTEPVADKWAACGWHVARVDGNDVDALLGAFDAVSTSVPSVILCDTKVGRGVPLRVDGNDIAAMVAAFDELRAHRGSPKVLICDTRIGRGSPLLENREKAHFMRIDEDEWQICRDQLTEGYQA